MRLVQLRILQIDLNIVERSFPGFDLDNLIPTIVLLPPAIEIPQPDIAIVNRFCTDRCVRAQYARRHVLLIPWTTRIDFLHSETTFPSTHVQKTVERHTSAHVLEFRKNSEDIP